MFLEDILKDGFMDYKKVYELAEENGIKKTEVKRQKALLGVKSVHVDGEEGGTLWLWFIPGKKPRPLQVKRMRQLKSLGFPVYVVDGAEQIGGVLDEICAT